MIEFVMKGIIIGLSVAIPIGPVALLCMRNTIAYGLLAGIISGIAASTAYVIYASIAGFGLTAISDFLIHNKIVISMLGGGFLIYLGIKTWRDTRVPEVGSAKKELEQHAVACFIPAFVLALTNPMTIVSFIAIFASLDMSSCSSSYTSALGLILGVFGGAVAWWIVLCSLVSLFRSRVTPSTMVVINQISGIIIIAFGLYIGCAALRG